MDNKTAMQDFLENIRNKKNTISRDVQNGHGHYYVIRLFEILEAECFSRLEKEKEQIKDAWLDGFKSSAEGWNGEMLPYYKDGEQRIAEHKEEYYNETYANDTTKGLPEEDSKRRAWHY
jgi:hypothetical protein